MINGRTWPKPHLALMASGDKSGALVRDGVFSARQGQGLTPTERRMDLIFTAGRLLTRWEMVEVGATCQKAGI